jgi:hypothetical protein
VDGAAQPGYDAVAAFMFSGDGSRYGYLAQVAKEAMAVIDGKESKRYAMAVGLVFSPDGRKYGYVIDAGAGPDGKLSNKQQLVYNAGAGEQTFKPFDRIGAIAFSPDGRRLALTGLTAEGWSVIVDGKVGANYEAAGMLQFSPDGKHLAVVAGRGRQQFIAIDGRELPPVDVMGPAGFSPDGARMAYVVRSGGQHLLMLDDKRIGPATFFAFTPDSKHLGHAKPIESSEQWQVAIDGSGSGPAYDGFPTGSRIVWDSATVGRLIAARGKEIYAVRVELQ